MRTGCRLARFGPPSIRRLILGDYANLEGDRQMMGTSTKLFASRLTATQADAATLAAVRKLLELSSCSFERAFYGLRETRLLAWVRRANIWFTTGPDFPYHFTVEGVAQLA